MRRLATHVAGLVALAVVATGTVLIAIDRVERQRDWESRSEITVLGQDADWRALTEAAGRRLDGALAVLSGMPELASAIDGRNSVALDTLIVNAAGRVDWAVLTTSFDPVVSSRDLGWTPPKRSGGAVDGGVVRLGTGGYALAAAAPISRSGGGTAGILVIMAPLAPQLADIKGALAADAYLTNRQGGLAEGTDHALWDGAELGGIDVAKPHLEHRRWGVKSLTAAVSPLRGGDDMVLGALVTVRDTTQTDRDAASLRNNQVIWLIVALLLAPLLALRLVERKAAALDRATNALTAIAQGNVDMEDGAPVERGELGGLGAAITACRQAVASWMVRLEQRERLWRRQDSVVRAGLSALSGAVAGHAPIGLAPAEPGRETARATLGLFEAVNGQVKQMRDTAARLSAEREREAVLAPQRFEADMARELRQTAGREPLFTHRDEFQVHVASLPAGRLGGDFHEVFLIDQYRLGFAIGAVTGQGVAAGMFGVMARALIKAASVRCTGPGECLGIVNTLMSVDNPHRLFATVFFGILDTRTGTIAFSNAAHAPPLVMRSDGSVEAIRDVSGVALGLAEETPYSVGRFRLQPGETVLVYTDGVIEAPNDRGQLFLERRLSAVAAQLSGQSAHDTARSVIAAVKAFSGRMPLSADVTTLALTFVRPSVFGEDGYDTSIPPALDGWDMDDLEGEMPSRIDVTVRRDVAELERLSVIVERFVTGHQLEGRLAFNLNLVLDMVISAIAAHEPDLQGMRCVEVSLEMAAGFLISEVVDDASEFNPLAAGQDPMAAVSVSMIKTFVTRAAWEYREGRNITTLWQDLERPDVE